MVCFVSFIPNMLGMLGIYLQRTVNFPVCRECSSDYTLRIMKHAEYPNVPTEPADSMENYAANMTTPHSFNN